MSAADILWMTKLGDNFDYRFDGRFEGTVFFHGAGSHFPCDLKRSLLSVFPDFDNFLEQNGFNARFDTGFERICNEHWDSWCAVLYIVFDTQEELISFNKKWFPILEENSCRR
jgi:hypothetical protein